MKARPLQTCTSSHTVHASTQTDQSYFRPTTAIPATTTSLTVDTYCYITQHKIIIATATTEIRQKKIVIILLLHHRREATTTSPSPRLDCRYTTSAYSMVSVSSSISDLREYEGAAALVASRRLVVAQLLLYFINQLLFLCLLHFLCDFFSQLVFQLLLIQLRFEFLL
eukprot:GHVU01099304.1.p1 GENE.GHVU01099304.1~~GHVU01099304.1.p1  ORF type:complete len:168 (+),score=11.84 GHVU01099304.1:85-588(+)